MPARRCIGLRAECRRRGLSIDVSKQQRRSKKGVKKLGRPALVAQLLAHDHKAALDSAKMTIFDLEITRNMTKTTREQKQAFSRRPKVKISLMRRNCDSFRNWVPEYHLDPVPAGKEVKKREFLENRLFGG